MCLVEAWHLYVVARSIKSVCLPECKECQFRVMIKMLDSALTHY